MVVRRSGGLAAGAAPRKPDGHRRASGGTGRDRQLCAAPGGDLADVLRNPCRTRRIRARVGDLHFDCIHGGDHGDVDLTERGAVGFAMGAGGMGEGRGNEWLEQVADHCRIGVDLVPFTAVESDADGGMGRRLATHEGVDDRPQRVGTRCNQR